MMRQKRLKWFQKTTGNHRQKDMPLLSNCRIYLTSHETYLFSVNVFHFISSLVIFAVVSEQKTHYCLHEALFCPVRHYSFFSQHSTVEETSKGKILLT